MAKYVGKGGVVLIGANAIGNIVSYSYEEQVSPINQKGLGDQGNSYSSTATDHPASWSAQVSVHFDEADTAQAAMTLGAEVTAKFQPRGTGSTLPEAEGTGIIDSIQVSAETDGMLVAEFSILGSGILDHTAQA